MNRNIQNINANMLVALDALLAERSVTRAAKRVGLTQSSMSGTLAQLRNLFGDPLLVRVGRTMQPTPFAERIAADLRRGVDAFNAALTDPAPFDPAVADASFVLAMSDRVEALVLPGLLGVISRSAPRITLQVVPWGRLIPPARLGTGEIDLSIGIVVPDASEERRSDLGVPPLPSGHIAQKLFDSSLASIVRKNHPTIGARLTLKRFCEADHVLVTENLGDRGIVDVMLERAGRTRRIAARVPRHTLVGPLIKQTDLVATIDRRIAESLAKRHQLRVFKPPVDLPRGDICMVWHERTDADPGRQWLRSLVAAETARYR